MTISLGFSPCPNDTFMFAAMANHWIDTGGLSFDIRMEDIETLNQWADEGKLQVTKLSFHKALYLENVYGLLDAGAALGRGCGPLLIAKSDLPGEIINVGPIALPGKWTTANLLFSIFYPEATNKQFHRFNRIESLVLEGEVAAGVIIHENRFTYESKGLVKLRDLGEAWETRTGLPIPLGGIFATTHLEPSVHRLLAQTIRASIEYAYAHPEQVMEYVRQYSQEMDEDVMKQHIELYVNDFSLDLGEEGRAAVRFLKKMARPGQL
jgi:1,4-dihydroxy-6-naphthoate synthase